MQSADQTDSVMTYLVCICFLYLHRQCFVSSHLSLKLFVDYQIAVSASMMNITKDFLLLDKMKQSELCSKMRALIFF